ncbi:MAG: hypothetical protein ACXWL5_01040 [Candidatus Chromulinivorax sp.]
MKSLLLLFLGLFNFFFIDSFDQESFLENTQVLTPTGYQKVQDLSVGDLVYDQNFQEKIVTNIFQYLANQYIQINIDDEIINCAINQQLYISAYQSWIKACQLTQNECDLIKIINQPALIYCLTVQDHTFQLSDHNIIAHNSAAAIIAPSIILNFIQLTQPVLALLGATLSLCYLSSYNQATEQGNTIIYQPSPEKTYFDTRYQQLCKLKQDFLSVHAAAKTINCQFQDLYGLLNYQPIFNRNCMHTCTINAEYEAQLDFEQRLQLTHIRQKILQDFEDEICNIQISIGLFVNEIIQRKNITTEYYNNFINNIQSPLHNLLRLPADISYQDTLDYYIFTASCNMLLEELINRNQECLILDQCFYRTYQPFFTTTNILEILDETKQDIIACQAIIEKTKLGNQVKLQNVTMYFNKNCKYIFPNISVPISNVQKDLYQKINTFQQKSHTHGYSPIKPPQKPDPDDDDEKEIPRIYVGVKYHAKNATAIKSAAPKNGQAALDFSLPISPRIRVGISENQIVVLGRTLIKPEGGSEWHGYATTWDDLNYNQESDIIKTLKRNGLVKNNGKIL